LKAFKNHAEDIFDILKKGEDAYNTEGEQDFINQNYPLTRSVSVDYAIMEKADNVHIIPGDFGWSDLGTWASLHAESKKDDSGNVLQGGQVLTNEVSDSIIRIPTDTFAVLRGLNDFIIILDNNNLLIYPKSKEQEIKQVTELIKKSEWKNRL
jgi:mannose-1-phosphate guanylyltransferase